MCPTCGAAARGSSPLARGLRVEPGVVAWHGRIIPARAGFTGPAPGGARRREDHPRSRGVYPSPPARGPPSPGSSPLARGLPDDQDREGGGPGIIPARAGFTLGGGATVRAAGDHPRSRGVYTARVGTVPDPSWIIPARAGFTYGECCECCGAKGSSPLARGLPASVHGKDGTAGIIPARAGFTPRRRPGTMRPADHPRSRGVYRPRAYARPQAPGSSPLARGLQIGGPVTPSGPRIIPARAGFTPHPGRGGRAGRDHPRSRGVYRAPRSSTRSWTGSSPLARGLRGRCRRWRCRGRIIPARAGFTRGRQRDRVRWPDHPRSRGVYTPMSRRPTRRDGSSPLARGLRADTHVITGADGIIPARAGFTSTTRSTSVGGCGSSPLARGLLDQIISAGRARRIIPARAGFTVSRVAQVDIQADHPRSRGVYDEARQAVVRALGSSPLARGLLTAVRGSRIWVGIIPARAGFTSRRERQGRVAGDHPRSRGVYLPVGRGQHPGLGSSPLARGLQVADEGGDGGWGIIPARAGFTTWSISAAPPRTDHPRSRGVYTPMRCGSSRRCGSSPLARGLLPRGLPDGLAPGIIPARAGFTGEGQRRPQAGRDHPRSRGVYTSSKQECPPRTGSSPLARGLPAVIDDQREVTLDHPRSRGVYSSIHASARVPSGSSPLARGLLSALGGLWDGLGIIPARAGFTARWRGPAGPHPDHPRSRGVYAS